MVIKDIIKGIANQIYNEFGEEYRIYDENVEQGLKEPCFLIAHLQSFISPLLGERCLLTNAFDIHFFDVPGNQKGNETMYAVLERLTLILDHIPFRDGSLHGTSVSGEIVDGVLHFFISFNLTANKPTENVDKMDEIEFMGGLDAGENETR